MHNKSPTEPVNNIAQREMMNTAYQALTLPGYQGYKRLYITEYVTGRKQQDNRYNDFPTEWNTSQTTASSQSNVTSQTTNNEKPQSARSQSAPTVDSIPVNRLWRSIYTSSCVNSTLSNMTPTPSTSSDQPVSSRSLPLSYNLFRSASPISAYKRDMGQCDPSLGPLARTIGQPSILDMSTTAPLFAATAKSNPAHHAPLYGGHVPSRDKQFIGDREKAWMYDVTTTNV